MRRRHSSIKQAAAELAKALKWLPRRGVEELVERIRRTRGGSVHSFQRWGRELVPIVELREIRAQLLTGFRRVVTTSKLAKWSKLWGGFETWCEASLRTKEWCNLRISISRKFGGDVNEAVELLIEVFGRVAEAEEADAQAQEILSWASHHLWIKRNRWSSAAHLIETIRTAPIAIIVQVRKHLDSIVRRRRRQLTERNSSLADAFDQRLTPAEEVAERESFDRLVNAIAQLPKASRRVIEARLTGLSFAQIGAILNRSPATVYRLHNAALKQLMKQLPELQ